MPVYGGLVPLGFTHSEDPAVTVRIRSYYTKSGGKSKGTMGLDGKIVSAVMVIH